MKRLELWYPVKPFNVTQPFGVNGEFYRANGINVSGHTGIDIKTEHGQPVYATHDGMVVNAGIPDNKEGYGVVLRTLEPYEYESGKAAYIKSISWHLLKDIPVTSGQFVKAGEIIGYADNTGFSFGDHLHFAIKPQMPGEEDWIWYNIENDNGYFGSINPQPFFNNYYAEDASLVVSILQKIISILKQALKL